MTEPGVYIEQKRYNKAERYDKAEKYSLLALTMSKQTLGSDHPLVAHKHNNLAELFRVQGKRKYDLAEQHYKKALAIYKEKLGSECLQVALVERNYAIVLRAKNKLEEASRIEIEAAKILVKHKLENP